MTLVIGICKTLGTDVEKTIASLSLTLVKHGYHVRTIRLSQEFLIGGIPIRPLSDGPVEKWQPVELQLMQRGNDLCAQNQHEVILAQRAVDTIRRNRGDRAAFIVTSLKRPEEVRALREIYGHAFLLVSVDADEQERSESLRRSLRQQYPLAAECEIDYWRRRLTVADDNDGDKWGQRAAEVHSQADLFLTSSRYTDPEQGLSRALRALLGAPFSSPSRDEYFMQIACTAASRSSERGRQVGAALVDEHDELLAVGCNEVPKPGGGQYWPEDQPDARDFVQLQDSNARLKSQIIREIEERVGAWTRADFREILAETQLGEIIEFGRITHGEMSAICSAAATGRSLRRAKLYVTTYPCHMCMRLIIACGISTVVYLHPYPKSRVDDLYSAEVTHSTRDSSERVLLRRFVGITGIQFTQAFSGSGRRAVGKYDDGRLQLNWNSCPDPGNLIPPAAAREIASREDAFSECLRQYLSDHGWTTTAPPKIPDSRQGTPTERRITIEHGRTSARRIRSSSRSHGQTR